MWKEDTILVDTVDHNGEVIGDQWIKVRRVSMRDLAPETNSDEPVYLIDAKG